MPSIKRQAPQRVLEDLAEEFTLDDAQLLEITQQFLDDFRTGLSEYGHPMAMM
jgi:hexokinase